LAIAVDQGYFSQEGLDVTLRDCVLGKSAFEEMLAGKSDYAVQAETPVVVKSFSRKDFRIIATLGTTDNLNSIAVRRDRGITSVEDLRGRRIATSKGVLPHYFLDLLLAKHGMSEKDIVPVFLEPDKLEAALVEGRVDAIATTNNNARKAQLKLGAQCTLLEEAGLCLASSILTTSKNKISTNQDQIEKIFRALRKAEYFKQQYPDRSREIVMALLHLSRLDYDAVWGRYSERVALGDALLLTLEEQASWVMQKGIITQQNMPNFLDVIDAEPLRKVAPESVRLKR
jgi:NitT/TauT family transport system substrate-binding protein